MASAPKLFYKYRAFNALALDSLCHDTVYLSNPGAFNDPLDCVPTVEGDSSIEDLRNLLEVLITRRVQAEILGGLKQAGLKAFSYSEKAQESARIQARKQLSNVAYNATNPEYGGRIVENESWLIVREIEHELNRHYERGVCAFSTSYASPLLWSHYGDQHRGLCIGYGMNRNPPPLLQKVIYGGSRLIQTSTLYRAFVQNDENALSALDRDVLLRKAKGWSYEREWRLIDKQGLQDSPLLLKSVTFGIRCSSSIQHSVVSALSGRDGEVDFFEMHTVDGSFTLRRRLLDLGELGAFLPRTAFSGIEMFGDIKGKE